MRKWQPLKRHPNIYEYKTKKGKRFGVRRSFTNSEGKEVEFTKSGFRTWRDADVVLKRFEVKLTNGELKPLTNRSVTVDQYNMQMSKRKIKLGIWKKSTAKNHRNYYTHYLKPKFGDVPLNEVSRIAYRDLLDKYAEAGLAKTTLHTIDSVMQSIMNDAADNDIIVKNKLRKLYIAGGREPKDQTLQPAQYEHWLACAKQVLDKYLLAMVYILTLGERRGELMGLRESAFEFFTDKNTGIETCGITWKEQRTSDELNGGTLKTSSSYRTNYVDGYIVELIHFAINEARHIRELRNKTEKDGFIFINSATAKPLHPTYPNRVLKKVDKVAGIHVNPHLLRHYFASQALSNPGTPEMDAMHWLGHKNLQMTANYSRDTKPASIKFYNNIKENLKLNGTKSSK